MYLVALDKIRTHLDGRLTYGVLSRLPGTPAYFSRVRSQILSTAFHRGLLPFLLQLQRIHAIGLIYQSIYRTSGNFVM